MEHQQNQQSEKRRVMSKVTNKTLWGIPALLALALVFALGCGASSEPAKSSAAGSASLSLPQMGTQVGNQILPFTLRLADGSIVMSGDLVSQKRPTFLLFYKFP
jgi:hypothetical protein